MSVQAQQIRSRRQHFAAPGGSHDRLIGFLNKVLPAGIGVVAAVMILVPLSPRGEVSFLLDRNKVAVVDERLAVDNAAYRGEDKRGRPFVLTAGDAVQKSAEIPVVSLNRLVAKMDMHDGPAQIQAPSGKYNYDDETLAIDGPVSFSAANGYKMETQNVAIDMKSKVAKGTGGVNGAVPTGTFQAQTLTADLENRTVTLEGNARLRMTPGKLRIPE